MNYFSDMCEVAKCNYDSIGHLTYLSFFDVYETIICDQCGNRDSDCDIVGFGNVCHCIDYGEFYYCDSCESLCSTSSGSYELVNNMSVLPALY